MSTCARDCECLGYLSQGMPNVLETAEGDICVPCLEAAQRFERLRTNELEEFDRRREQCLDPHYLGLY